MQAARRRLVRPVLLGTLLLSLLAAACGGDGEPGTPAASEPSPVTEPKRTTTTEALTPEEEVEAAYLRSWEVYAEAVRTLDPSGLEEVYADRALKVVAEEINDRRSRVRPGRVEISHDYHIELVEPTVAIVRDRYRNHSVLVDPETAEPIEKDPDETIVETYQLELMEDGWKVVHFVRESSSQS